MHVDVHAFLSPVFFLTCCVCVISSVFLLSAETLKHVQGWEGPYWCVRGSLGQLSCFPFCLIFWWSRRGNEEKLSTKGHPQPIQCSAIVFSTHLEVSQGLKLTWNVISTQALSPSHDHFNSTTLMSVNIPITGPSSTLTSQFH